jgi:hypothetical protein
LDIRKPEKGTKSMEIRKYLLVFDYGLFQGKSRLKFE